MYYPAGMSEKIFFMMTGITWCFWIQSAKWLTIMMNIIKNRQKRFTEQAD